MNEDMIEYLANMERRVNKLADQIEDLKSIMVETFRKEGGSQICPHRYEFVQAVKHDTQQKFVLMFVVCVVRPSKRLLTRKNKRKVLLPTKTRWKNVQSSHKTPSKNVQDFLISS